MQEKLKSFEIEVPLHISVSVISHLIGARRSMKIDFFFFQLLVIFLLLQTFGNRLGFSIFLYQMKSLL